MSPGRVVSPLLLLVLPAAAGWFGAIWAREGLQPASRRHVPVAPQQVDAREPHVEPSSREGTWMARVKAARPGDYAALFDELDSLFPAQTSFEARFAAQKWLLSLWVARDAEAAAAFVGGKTGNDPGNLFGLVLGSVAPDKVVAILDSPLRVDLGNLFPAAALRALAEAHPDEFLKLNPQDLGNAYSEQYHLAMKNVAASNPAAAAEAWLHRGAAVPYGKDTLYTVLGAWTSRDPQAARRWADSLTDPDVRRLAHHAWLGTLAKTDLAAARRELAAMDLGAWLPGVPGGMDEPALQYPQDARTVVFAAMARADFAAALGELENMVRLAGPLSPTGLLDRSPSSPAKLLRSALAEAATEALPNDPAALFEAWNKLTASSTQSLSSNLTASIRLGILDAKSAAWEGPAALQALQLISSQSAARAGCGQSEILMENMLVQQLTFNALRPDPGAALELISHMPEAERGRVAQSAFFAMASESPDLVARAASMVPPELWNKNMGEQFGRSPQDYASLFTTLPETGKSGEAQTAFTKTWARDDPDAVAQWITSLPPAAAVAPAARGLTEGWAAYDETAASAWAAALPAGRSRDGAALGLASAVAAAEPEAAWQWAASISDAALSADAFTSVARQWGRDAAPEFRQAFAAALDRSGCTADAKAAALRALDAPRPSPPPPP